MTNALEDIILRHIRQSGPMDIATFMNYALSHTEHGYYMKQDPFGRTGDFVTAPEISQMFGEMLGVWAADLWMKMGSPAHFILLECGPGRGTLMADIMRATKHVQGFHEAAHINLLEISPALRAKQAESLKGYDPIWHSLLETLEDEPIICIANEFLDALPFHQLVKTKEGWAERIVTEKGGELIYGLQKLPLAFADFIPASLPDADEGEVFEISPARQAFVENLGHLLLTQGGGALLIDYGPAKYGYGDTFQALKDNAYSNPLADVGDCDLTSHVMFEALKADALHMELDVKGPCEQGAFLNNLGIGLRAQALKGTAKDPDSIEKDLHRLTASDQMGELFKVFYMGSDYGEHITPAGF